MFRIIKPDMQIHCDTASEMRFAVEALGGRPVPEEPVVRTTGLTGFHPYTPGMPFPDDGIALPFSEHALRNPPPAAPPLRSVGPDDTNEHC